MIDRCRRPSHNFYSDMRDSLYRKAVLPGWLRLFLAVLRHRPDRAIRAAYHYITRRKVRAYNRLLEAGATLPNVYRVWIDAIEQREFKALVKTDVSPSAVPTFSIVIDAALWTNHSSLDATIRSVRAQSDTSGRLIVSGTPSHPDEVRAGETYLSSTEPGVTSALQVALAAADGDFTIVVPPDAILPPWAIARYREAARDYPDATILYGDEDGIDNARRRSRPWFKPQWNAELILAQDYVSNACAIATPIVRAIAITAEDFPREVGYALVLAAVAQPGTEVRHIPHVLCHMPLLGTPRDVTERRRVVAAHVAVMQATAEIGPFDTVRVHWPLPDPAPSVTIIVPTRDSVDLLEACIGSLLRETDYPNYNVVVVDNGSVLPQTHAWFAAVTSDDRVSILPYNRPYNYSAINNFAASRARGQYLCLLNNDTEIIDGAWLGALMRYAVRPDVGAVGAKLLYADHTIQHAGVVIGLGNAAGHAHRMLPDDQVGYFAVAHSAYEASAVTAACLVVEADKFAAVGGLDEADLQIAYNDVDLCLKLTKAGWRNIYAPQAVLIHHESKSRGLDMSPQHIERYRRELAVLQQRWSTASVVDRMHHPRLDRASETYRIRI